MKSRHINASLVVSLLALFVALSGGAYALSRGDVKTRDIASGAVTKPKLGDGAVSTKQVNDFGLRLRDLGGRIDHGRSVLSAITVPPGGCTGAGIKLFNPPGHVVGSLVVGFLTDDRGNAVLNNNDVVVPTTVSGSSQGGAEANVVICNHDNLGQAIPAGSVFHYQLIAP